MTPLVLPADASARRTAHVVPEQRRADAGATAGRLDPHVRRAIALAELSQLAADES